MSIVAYNSWDIVIDNMCASLGSPDTRRAYKGHVEKFISWRYSLEESYSSPAAYIDRYKLYQLDRGIKPSTVNLKLSAIKALFRTAARDGIITEDQFKLVDSVQFLKSSGVHTGTWLTTKQLHQLRTAPDPKTAIGLRDRLILYLLIGCGLRRSELSRLVWGRVVKQGESWQLRNITGKGEKKRTVPIPTEVMEVLDQVGRGEEDELIVYRIFKNGRRKPGISGTAIRGIVNTYAKQCGFGLINPHDMRRSIAKILYDRSEILSVQKFLGHSSIATTQIYMSRIVDLDEMAANLSLEVDDEIQN